MDGEKLLLKVGEAAKFLGVGVRTFFEWRKRGLLVPVRLPGVTGEKFDGDRFDRRDLVAFVDKLKGQPNA